MNTKADKVASECQKVSSLFSRLFVTDCSFKDFYTRDETILLRTDTKRLKDKTCMYDVQMADKGTTNMLEPYSDGSVTLRGSFRWCSLQQPVSLKKGYRQINRSFISER